MPNQGLEPLRLQAMKQQTNYGEVLDVENS